jgi:hypothetical protein
MRKKGETSVMCAGKSAIPPDEVMISPLPSKVNNPLHLADFAALRDCSVVEIAPVARLKALSSTRNRSENRRA